MKAMFKGLKKILWRDMRYWMGINLFTGKKREVVVNFLIPFIYYRVRDCIRGLNVFTYVPLRVSFLFPAEFLVVPTLLRLDLKFPLQKYSLCALFLFCFEGNPLPTSFSRLFYTQWDFHSNLLINWQYQDR